MCVARTLRVKTYRNSNTPDGTEGGAIHSEETAGLADEDKIYEKFDAGNEDEQ